MVKLIYACAALLVCTASANAQYPFEKYKAPVTYAVPKWADSLGRVGKGTVVAVSTIRLDSVFSGGDKCIIRVESPEKSKPLDDGAKISIYRNKRLIQVFEDENAPHYYFSMGFVAVADYNGDGLPDIKMVVPYMSNGLGLDEWDIYLIQERDGYFVKIAFFNLYSPDRQERDMDNDGHFVIIGMQLEGYGRHNYFVYNLYKFNADTLKGISERFGYPLMYQFLERENYKAAKIPYAIRKKYLMLKPPEYNVDDGKRFGSK